MGRAVVTTSTLPKTTAAGGHARQGQVAYDRMHVYVLDGREVLFGCDDRAAIDAAKERGAKYRITRCVPRKGGG